LIIKYYINFIEVLLWYGIVIRTFLEVRPHTNYYEFSPTTQRAFRRFGIVFSNCKGKLTLEQINYKGGRFRQFDIPVEQGYVILIKYYTHDIAVWVAPERSVDSFIREFRAEEMSNLLRSDSV
jgi:hypothetical protein